MNRFKIFLLIILLIPAFRLFSQRFELNFSSGTNFSNIDYKSESGRWQSSTGPVSGISLDYNLSKILSLRSEINYIALSYEYKTYYSPPVYWYLSSYWPGYYNPQQDWKLQYIRMPFSLTLRTPTRLSFYASAGYYYASLLKDHWKYESEIPSSDRGFIFTNGLSYRFDNKLKVFAELRYSLGKEDLILQNGEKNGAVELNFGLGYLFPSKHNKQFNFQKFSDSIPTWTIKYSAGGMSTLPDGKYKSHYRSEPAMTAGVSVSLNGKSHVSAETGVLYIRNSYSITDSSSMYYRYIPDINKSFIDTRTDVDYLSIPLVINLSYGKRIRFYSGIGLYRSFCINSRVTGIAFRQYESEGSLTMQKYEVYDNIKDKIRDNDNGWLIHAGIQLPVFGKFKIDIGCRYQSSFDKLFKQDSNSSVNLKYVGIMAGLVIPII